MIEWIFAITGGVVAAFVAGLWLAGSKNRAREAVLVQKEREQIKVVLEEAGRRAREIIEQAEGVRRELRANVTQASDRLVERVWQANEAELKQALADMQAEVRQAAGPELIQVRRRLETFEAEAKKQLQKDLQAALPKLVARLAGTSIPLEVHEDLVVQAVEEAAAEGFFANQDGHK